MRPRFKIRIGAILIGLVICLGLTSLIMPEVVYKLPYIKIVEEDTKSAIIYVWGHLYFVDTDYYENSGLTYDEIEQIEKKSSESVFGRIQELRDKWKWDLYIFYGILPNFRRYEYDNLLIFFSGHGKYNNDQDFMINKEQIILVKELGEGIKCKNLTVVVESCYSLNWQNDFKYKNLTAMFTSDLCNGTTPYKPYPEHTTKVEYLASFNYFFISYLCNGFNYAETNRTTFETFYSIFPISNCSNGN